MYLFVPCDKKSHGTEISFPIRSNRLLEDCFLADTVTGMVSPDLFSDWLTYLLEHSVYKSTGCVVTNV